VPNKIDFNSRRISYSPKSIQEIQDHFQQQLLKMAPDIEPSPMVKLMTEVLATQSQQLTFELNMLVSAPSLTRARQMPDVPIGTRLPSVDYTPIHGFTEYAAQWPVLSLRTLSMDEILTRRFNILRREGTTSNDRNPSRDFLHSDRIVVPEGTTSNDRNPSRDFLHSDRIVVPEPNGNRDVFTTREIEGFAMWDATPAITGIHPRALRNARTSIQEDVDAEIFAALDEASRRNEDIHWKESRFTKRMVVVRFDILCLSNFCGNQRYL
jgi:hypothetical protein